MNEEVKENEKIEKEELKQEIIEEIKKENKGKKKRHIFSKIFTLFIWIIVIAWIGIIAIDYLNTVNEKELQFCLEKEVIEYDDGSVSICKGLGYKSIRYKRTSIDAIEFGPFWIKLKDELPEKN